MRRCCLAIVILSCFAFNCFLLCVPGLPTPTRWRFWRCGATALRAAEAPPASALARLVRPMVLRAKSPARMPMRRILSHILRYLRFGRLKYQCTDATPSVSLFCPPCSASDCPNFVSVSLLCSRKRSLNRSRATHVAAMHVHVFGIGRSGCVCLGLLRWGCCSGRPRLGPTRRRYVCPLSIWIHVATDFLRFLRVTQIFRCRPRQSGQKDFRVRSGHAHFSPPSLRVSPLPLCHDGACQEFLAELCAACEAEASQFAKIDLTTLPEEGWGCSFLSASVGCARSRCLDAA